MRAVGLSILIATSVIVEQTSVAQTNPPTYQQPDYQQQPPPGYQQQPPPGYQQPPPGYQQPPPGYQQPPPGYQQPPPGYQQPPPGYQQPPGYYQQPPTAYQPPPPGYAAGPPPPMGKHGFLALPYIGIHSHQDEADSGLDPGFILGGLIGGRVNPTFSINGELRFDFLNPKNVATDYDISAVEVDLALSPLFHIPFPNGEFVVGPKLGVFAGSWQVNYGGINVETDSWSGYVVGFNSGLFFDVSRSVALGGMLSFTIRDPLTTCVQLNGGTEDCNSDINYVSEKVLGFHAGALF